MNTRDSICNSHSFSRILQWITQIKWSCHLSGKLPVILLSKLKCFFIISSYYFLAFLPCVARPPAYGIWVWLDVGCPPSCILHTFPSVHPLPLAVTSPYGQLTSVQITCIYALKKWSPHWTYILRKNSSLHRISSSRSFMSFEKLYTAEFLAGQFLPRV